jgi:hypothetical protein
MSAQITTGNKTNVSMLARTRKHGYLFHIKRGLVLAINRHPKHAKADNKPQIGWNEVSLLVT